MGRPPSSSLTMISAAIIARNAFLGWDVEILFVDDGVTGEIFVAIRREA